MGTRLCILSESGIKGYLISLVLIFFGQRAFAQDTLDTNDDSKDVTNQFWVDYTTALRFTNQLDFYGGIGFRTVVPHAWDRVFLQPAIRYQLPKLFFRRLKYREELHGGFGIFFTSNVNTVNRLEIRPFQGYRLDWPDRPRLRIRHYVRLEERFDLNTDNWSNTFGLRLRYLAELTIKLQGDWLSFNKGIYLPFRMELFWNLIGAQQFNDKFRLNTGIGYEFSKKWRMELQLGYHYTRNTAEDAFTTNDIVYRLRAFCRIK